MQKNRNLIEWLVPYKVDSLACLNNCEIASIRLRVAVAANITDKALFDNEFNDGANFAIPEILFVGKIELEADPKRAERWLSRIKQCAAKGTKIVVDYADNHLAENQKAANFYKNAFKFSTAVVCSSTVLASNVRRYYQGPVKVIEDPIEVLIQEPKKLIPVEPRALWFGDVSNLKYLVDFLKNSFKSKQKASLCIMTNLQNATQEILEINQLKHLDYLKIEFLNWNLPAMQRMAFHSDMCWIPAGINDDRKSGASSNRLLTSLSLGLPTAADNLASYKKYRGFYIELRAGDPFQHLNHQREDTIEKITKIQKQIGLHYSKQSIGNRWTKFIEQFLYSDEGTIQKMKLPRNIYREQQRLSRGLN
jgi:hypothetical protein